MGKIGIIKEKGIEEIVFKEDMPKLIFGLSNAPAQKEERESIGNALMKIGLPVYASTNTLWLKDAYVSNNGLVIAERDFGNLAHGGNYIFGDGFVLVSGAIKDDLEQRLRDSEHFRNFFSGSEIIFVPPYSRKIKGVTDFKLKPKHIDLTIGYVPKENLLSVSNVHYLQEEEIFRRVVERFGVNVNKKTPAKHFPNSFFSIEYCGEVIVVANKLNNPFKNRKNNFRVIETGENIVYLPGLFGGSVKCVVNISPTTKLWDALGIEYKRWGINPKQPSYAMR